MARTKRKNTREPRSITALTLIARHGSGAGKHQDRRLKRLGDRSDNWKRDQEISS